MANEKAPAAAIRNTLAPVLLTPPVCLEGAPVPDAEGLPEVGVEVNSGAEVMTLENNVSRKP